MGNQNQALLGETHKISTRDTECLESYLEDGLRSSYRPALSDSQ